MARGPHPKPELDRYRAFGWQAALYLIEAGDCIKVGRADAIARRLMRLHVQLRKQGQRIGRIEIFPVDGLSALYKGEPACIRALRTVAKNVGRSREYFTGITYDEALAVVRAAIPA